jgi:sulfoxide reductase heme-binding subunit YedZ
VLGWNWPLQVRQVAGLCAFAYVCMHFLVYLVLDQFFAWDEIWKDIAQAQVHHRRVRGLLLLMPLASPRPTRW